MRTIIFKAIEKCNSNCVYCDVIKKHQKVVMNFELVELIFSKINEFLLKYPKEEIEFLWHGGEVCLLGPEYFRQAREIQNKQCLETRNRIRHTIQSNLTLINPEIILELKELGINNIGTSYDMFQGVRGLGAKRNSDRYNQQFLEGIEMLERYEMSYGVIYVVHKKAIEDPVRVFNHLTNLFDYSIMFNMIHVYGVDKFDLRITEEEFAHFLGAIFPEWWKNRYTLPQIKPFRDFYHAVTSNNLTSACVNTGSCSFRWLYINPEGKVAHCSEGGDYGYPDYGNIQDHSLEYLYSHPIREKLQARNYLLPKNHCAECNYWGLCHGGCSWASYNRNKDFSIPFGCKMKKIFFKEYFEPVTGLKVNMKPIELYRNEFIS